MHCPEMQGVSLHDVNYKLECPQEEGGDFMVSDQLFSWYSIGRFPSETTITIWTIFTERPDVKIFSLGGLYRETR
jgi:hypothetical protein